MMYFKLTKKAALVFQVTQAILELAFDVRVMIGQATIGFTKAGVGPDDVGSAFHANVSGVIRGNITFTSCAMFLATTTKRSGIRRKCGCWLLTKICQPTST